MRTTWGVALACATLMVAGSASAHDLTCDKTANGQKILTIDTYPTTVTYEFTVHNVHPTMTSDLLTADDPVSKALTGFQFGPLPIAIPVGQSVTQDTMLTIHSYEECLRFAALDGVKDDTIENTLTVTFDQGEAMCSAKVICKKPEQPPPPPENNTTRTMGFYKTHESATEQCIATDVDLGAYLTIHAHDLAAALGLLWGSPSKNADGTKRTKLEQDRFLLARQLFVAICNNRLFGSSPSGVTFTDAITTLNSDQCTDMGTVQGELDAFNGSGDSLPFPQGFVPGPATPQDAKGKAVDPTVHQSGACAK
jgi:hypothetical protein